MVGMDPKLPAAPTFTPGQAGTQTVIEREWTLIRSFRTAGPPASG
jgi:hypothetical protein